MNENQLLYQVALGMIPGVGSITGRRLIDHTDSLRDIFKGEHCSLQKIPGIGRELSKRIRDSELLLAADREVNYILKNNIKPLFYRDPGYPERLNQCHDAPLIIYVKGTLDLNPARIISVVGTRNPSDYGIHHCRSLIKELATAHRETIIVSGLAYGIDVCAHKSALDNQLPTIAVLGHGFRHMYPAAHWKIAGKIERNGALLTEFCSTTKPERNNFIRRNRIIAGLSDATLIVQSGVKGGALITAAMANAYNRDVFALPGRIEDKCSSGCNQLIKSQRASLIENIADLEYLLGWTKRDLQGLSVQPSLFSDLEVEEKIIINLLSDRQIHSVDSICIGTDMPVSKVSAILLKLEFSGLVYCMPGNLYRLCK
jgi:DNA processing protein